MKFEAVIGNPPYQEIVSKNDGNKSLGKQLFPLFIQLATALSKSVLDENAIFDDDVCRYILSNTKLTEEYYIEQAEKELQEEGKDE